MMTYGAYGAIVLLVAALAADVRTMTIPNKLTMPALGAGILMHAVVDGPPGLRVATGGAAVGIGILLVVYLLRAVGAGDVKVFAALGAWLGPAVVSDLAIYSIMIAAVYGVVTGLTWRLGMQRIWKWAGWEQKEAVPMGSSRAAIGIGIRIPFMLAVCPGAAAAWLLG